MLSQLVLGLSLWMPSLAYAGLSPFHMASSVAHESSDMVPAGASAHAPLPITWSPGIQQMTERMAEGAQADMKTQSLHNVFLEDQRELTEEEIEEVSMRLVQSVEKVKSKEWTLRSRKLQEDVFKTTTLIAPSIDPMKKTYSATELIHIEKKARQLKQGFDYTYIGDNTFVRNEKSQWEIDGYCGRIRVYDEQDHKLLYETGCCYCGGRWRSSHDLTTAESLLNGAVAVCTMATCGAGYLALNLLSNTL